MVAREGEWWAERAERRAKAAARAALEAPVGAPTPVVDFQDDGTPARRSKRARGEVDYAALQAKLESEQQAEQGAGMQVEGAQEGATPAETSS